jgi:hypothetical protein
LPTKLGFLVSDLTLTANKKLRVCGGDRASFESAAGSFLQSTAQSSTIENCPSVWCAFRARFRSRARHETHGAYDENLALAHGALRAVERAGLCANACPRGSLAPGFSKRLILRSKGDLARDVLTDMLILGGDDPSVSTAHRRRSGGLGAPHTRANGFVFMLPLTTREPVGERKFGSVL